MGNAGDGSSPATEKEGDGESPMAQLDASAPVSERSTAKAPDAGALKERKPSPSEGRRPMPPSGATGASKGADKEVDLMKNCVIEHKKLSLQNADTTAIFVGLASTGKSTLLKALQKKEEAKITSTLALQYSFLRRERDRDKGTEGGELVSHIWEIGGGSGLQELFDVPLTESTITADTTVVIVADLSKPEDVFKGVTNWLGRLRERLKDIETILKKSEAQRATREDGRGPSPKGKMDQLRARAFARFGKDHPDNSNGLVQHTGVNVVIVATKWDLFEKKDPEEKKMMARSLRFLAHTNGASLVYCAHNNVDRFRV